MTSDYEKAYWEARRQPVKVTPAMIKRIEDMMKIERAGAVPKKISNQKAFDLVYERWDRSIS
jgi:hypothetical protein